MEKNIKRYRIGHITIRRRYRVGHIVLKHILGGGESGGKSKD